ncbi:MAG: hypothetical protein AAF515_03690 [Pseudomonadota bacterium]
MDSDLRRTATVMAILRQQIADLLPDPSADLEVRFNNALLNVAVNRLVDAEGRAETATMLWRLADALAQPGGLEPDSVVELTALDG